MTDIHDWLASRLREPPNEIEGGILIYRESHNSYQQGVEFGDITDQHPSIRHLHVRFWNRYSPSIGDVVLDIGAGGMNLSSYIQGAFGSRVIALEVCRDALVKGSTFMEHYGVDRDRFARICTTALDVPLRDASVDTVVGASILHHFEDPSQVLREAGRVLVPGGLAVFQGETVSPCYGHPRMTSDEDHHFTPTQWRFHVRMSGLELIEIGYPEDILWKLSTKLGYIPKTRCLLSPLMFVGRLLKREIGVCLVAKKRSDPT